jgi:cardiolipin synthase
MQAGQILATVIAAIGIVAAAIASTHALLHKRRPQSAVGWIAVCLTLPFLGSFLYYLFGINRVETRARKLLTHYPEPLCPTEYVGTPPPQLWPPSVSINLRNHRKSLIVDGMDAFTGGINIRDRYVAELPADRIFDLHFRVSGPVVTQIETVFLRDWHFATGDKLTAARHAPKPCGGALCRIVADGPDGKLDRLTALFTGAIGSARQRVAIMTPYFLPPRELIAPLQAAALSGVDVAVVLPERNNLPYVHRATRHMLWELLERGVHVYYQPPPFVHSKLFYVDDYYAQIGSANFDPRSLRLNFEMNVEVYDRDTVTKLADHFEAVRSRSTQVTLASVDGRRFATKAIDGAAWLLSPYL